MSYPELDRRLTRPDGRTVAYLVAGRDDGRPLLRIPGTPGSRFGLRADTSIYEERNLRMISTERPGFGASTRLEGRGFLEHADDLAAILDDLGIDAVPVIGGSGAAPHILALLARHPDRVVAATVLVGAAPLDDDEVDAMIPLNAAAHRMREQGDLDGLRAMLEEHRSAILADPMAGFRAVMSEAPPGDQEVLSDPNYQRGLTRSISEALRPEVDGWMDEGLAIHDRWDEIDLASIRTSLVWWHARDDRNAPLSAAQRVVDRIPGAEMRVWDDGGHLIAYRLEADLIDELLARADRVDGGA